MFEFNPFSLVDAPDSCAIIFCRGCNLTCKYCYNLDLLNINLIKSGLLAEDIIQKIQALQSINPKGKPYTTVKWLIISGGEPAKNSAVYINTIISFLKEAKKIGLKTGIFTNGISRTLPTLLDTKLLDFVNIDFKHIDINQILKVHIGTEWSAWFNNDNTKSSLYSNIEKAYYYYNNYELDYLYINTVVCKSFHTKEVLSEMKEKLNEIISNIPIILKRESHIKLGWVLTPFFNDNNKLLTLGNLDYNIEKISKSELQNIVNLI
jgi:pyruvate-formate lyase-activating enzyme